MIFHEFLKHSPIGHKCDINLTSKILIGFFFSYFSRIVNFQLLAMVPWPSTQRSALLAIAER